jgi:hypothetical protein
LTFNLTKGTRQMNKEIKVSIKNVYGNELVYPACEVSKSFTRLTGAKTLTHMHLHIIKNELGYSVTVVAQTL